MSTADTRALSTAAGPAAEAVERRLDAALAELLALSEDVMPAAARHDLEEARRRLLADRVNLVVLGEFKRGKSTLVNALVEADVVPTGALPLTAAPTALRHGPRPRLVVSFAGGDAQEVELGRIADFATEAGNPRNRRGVRLLTIELPASLLALGVQLVDTPGIGSIHAHNTETALAFLAQVDAALVTLAADQPMSETEERLIRDAAGRIPRIFVALNKLDHLAPGERGESVDFVRARLRAVLGAEAELFPLSARSGEGLAALRVRLEGFATRERRAVLARSVRSLAAAFAGQAAQTARFEAHAVELPSLELEQRLGEFLEQSSRLERTRVEAAELLEQAARRLTARLVDEPLLSLAEREGPALCENLRALAAGSGSIAPRALARLLEAWIDGTIEQRFERLARELEEEIARELQALHVRYAQRVDSILAELDLAAADAFGAQAGRGGPEVRLRRPSRFSFKLYDEGEALDQLAALAAGSLPGAPGRALVRRRAEERLQAMLDRHAGRLRSDTAERIRGSVREYERELACVVREAASSVEAAVERARREQRGGRGRVSSRLDELRRLEARLVMLEAELASDARAETSAQAEGA